MSQLTQSIKRLLMVDEDQFTHTKDFQLKLLAYMLQSPDFRGIAKDALKREHFYDGEMQWLFKTLAEAPHTKTTLQEEIVGYAKEAKINEAVIAKYVSYYDFISRRVTPDEENYINKKLSRFLKTQALKTAIMDSWDLIKEGKWDAIVDIVQEASNAGADITDRGTDYFGELESRVLQRVAREDAVKIMTGIDELDYVLNGGIEAKQLGMVVGGTGRGKTLLMQFFARMAILAGKVVVYYTLEVSSEKIADRFDSLFAHIKMRELRSSNEELLAALNPMADRFKNRLMIKEYPADSATVATLRAHLRSLAGIGIVPDMVVVDYLDLLKPHRVYNNQTEEIDAITKALHGLSKELGVAIWTAGQLNRSGIAMDSPDETSIAGAIAKLFTVDLAIFIAQTNEEREDSEVRLVINKNRNGPAGRSIKINTDFEYMQFYRPGLEVVSSAELKVDKNTLVGQEHSQAALEEPEGVSAEVELVVME